MSARRPMRAMRAMRAMLAVAALGCRLDPTALHVVVDADPAVRARATGLRVRVYASSTAQSPTDQQVVTPADGGALVFPLSFTVVPRSGSSEARVEVDAVDGPSPDGFVRARSIAAFRDGETLVVPVVLWSVCAGQSCAAQQTCGVMGQCESAVVANPAMYRIDAEQPCATGNVRVGRACVVPWSADGGSDGGDGG